MAEDLVQLTYNISNGIERDAFQLFTDKANKVIVLAQEEARRLGHNFVGAVQILLGLVSEGTGIAAEVLKSIGINLEDARVEVEKIIGKGSGSVAVEIPFTPSVIRVLELSFDEAHLLGQNCIGTEHLLLGLLREEEGETVIWNFNVNPSNIREQVIRMIGETAESVTDFYSSNPKIVTLDENETNLTKLDGAMFELFTEKANIVTMLAQEEAIRLGHNVVGTEQILLGLIGEGTGIAAEVLRSVGINLEDARIEVEKIIGSDSGSIASEIPFSPRAKCVLEFASDESRKLGHTYIGTEHLLLGLLREEEGVAARVIENLGVNQSDIHMQVISMISENTEGVAARVIGNLGANPSNIHKQVISMITENTEGDISSNPIMPSKLARDTFELFTEKANKVTMLAQEEARRLGHNSVGTEHILLGLIGEGTGIAAEVLKSMEINLENARLEVEKVIGMGNGSVAVEIPFTPRAKRVLEFSLEEAQKLGHNYIGTEHLLLGLLLEGEGVAACVIENLGVKPYNIRTQVIRMIGEN